MTKTFLFPYIQFMDYSHIHCIIITVEITTKSQKLTNLLFMKRFYSEKKRKISLPR